MQLKTKLLAAFSFLLVLIGLIFVFVFETNTEPKFDGQRALDDVAYQISLGPRSPGSVAHDQIVHWIMQSLRAEGWQADIQETEYQGQQVRNVIAKHGFGEPWIILGAHYDSRLLADNDPDPENHDEPVPGANDGASGVAVLMELARALPSNLDKQVWLIFFDAEDNGRIEGWDWILGSRAFAESLNTYPDSVVIVDMIGDADLQIYLEANSDEDLRQQIWRLAADLGNDDVFINEVRHSMLDDHTPFLELGIPAVDIIDFDYPYWHTIEDTLDKVSSASLQAVGETLLGWLLTQ